MSVAQDFEPPQDVVFPLNLYLGMHENQLRYFTPEGELVSTPEEFAQQATQRAERMAAKLRELNIDPDSL